MSAHKVVEILKTIIPRLRLLFQWLHTHWLGLNSNASQLQATSVDEFSKRDFNQLLCQKMRKQRYLSESMSPCSHTVFVQVYWPPVLGATKTPYKPHCWTALVYTTNIHGIRMDALRPALRVYPVHRSALTVAGRLIGHMTNHSGGLTRANLHARSSKRKGTRYGIRGG